LYEEQRTERDDRSEADADASGAKEIAARHGDNARKRSQKSDDERRCLHGHARPFCAAIPYRVT
jgi:hypothetical protein